MIPAINEMMLAVSSSVAASIAVKATVLLALGLIGTSMARTSRAALRHALLAAVFAMLVVLPVACLLAPPLRIEVPVTAKARVASALRTITLSIPAGKHAVATSTPPPAGISPTTLWLTGWLGGAALFLSPALLGLWHVRSLRRSALPWPHGQAVVHSLTLATGIRRRVEVLLHEDLPVPMTCGVVHPVIVLPREAGSWSVEDLSRALVHELEHVRRGDWLSQCLARVVCSLYWFHPLVWMAWRKLTLEAERSCDDAVLGRSDATAYADQLVDLAQRISSAGKTPLLAMVSRSDLATRVGAVLDIRQRRGRAGTLPVALACTAAAMLVLTVSPFRMVAASPNTAAIAEAAPVVAAPVPEATPASPSPTPAAEAAPVPQPASEPAPQNASPPAQAAPVPQFMSHSQLVILRVTVTDLSGNSIDGLGARDFVVNEDGVAENIVTFEFQKLTGSPAGSPSSYYVLGYYPSNTKQDGQFRKIQVIEKNDSTAKLDYRTGYFPNKPLVNQAGDTPYDRPPAGLAASLPPGSTPPILIFKKEAEYTDVARKAKYQGTVTLNVEVSDTGTVSNVQVLQSLGLGLDEKAIEAVKQWRFKPATTNGVPVTMQTEVKVDFRLL